MNANPSNTFRPGIRERTTIQAATAMKAITSVAEERPRISEFFSAVRASEVCASCL